MVAAPPVAVANVIQTCIESDFDGWDGDTVFELCNGQVWVQTSYAYTYHYAYRPDAILVLGTGGWTMTVEGVRGSIRVQQVAFTRTCIEGTFNGWEGQSVFPMCNGQVWQQVSYDYNYSYAYRPSVLIYQAPSGDYRMQVEGETDTISVRRIS